MKLTTTSNRVWFFVYQAEGRKTKGIVMTEVNTANTSVGNTADESALDNSDHPCYFLMGARSKLPKKSSYFYSACAIIEKNVPRRKNGKISN